jgi:predicted aspartyl protease
MALEKEFKEKKYLASGPTPCDRIYNAPQDDLNDLIQRLAHEALPDDWETQVKVEEFNKFLLLVRGPNPQVAPEPEKVLEYLKSAWPYLKPYLRNLAIYDGRHTCHWFLTADILTVMDRAEIAGLPLASMKHNGQSFTDSNSLTIPFESAGGHMLVKGIVMGSGGRYEQEFLVDTGASMSMISEGLAQVTGPERGGGTETFQTARGSITCRIVTRTIRVGEIEVTQEVAVNPTEDVALLGVSFFEDKSYMVDSSQKRLYVWNK